MTRKQKFRAVYEKKRQSAAAGPIDAACLALAEVFKDKEVGRVQIARVYWPDMEMPEAIVWRAEVRLGISVRTIADYKTVCLEGSGETSIAAAENILENLP